MNKKFTRKYIEDNKGCYSLEELNNCSFIKAKVKVITLDAILKSEIKLEDKFWFIIRKTNLTIRQKQEIAIGCAEIVLEIYERRNPGNKAPAEAIQAAKDYINGLVDNILLIEKRVDIINSNSAPPSYSAYNAAHCASANENTINSDALDAINFAINYAVFFDNTKKILLEDILLTYLINITDKW